MKHKITATESPEFVCRETCARRCEISVDTWDQWVRDGYVPRPAIERGQIKRWHWPQVEARFTAAQDGSEESSDPYMQGVVNADQKARGRLAPR